MITNYGCSTSRVLLPCLVIYGAGRVIAVLFVLHFGSSVTPAACQVET